MTTAQHRRTTCRSSPRWSPARSSRAQTQVEAQNFEIRKNVLKYDDVLNRQREVIYAERRRVLEGEDLHEQIRHFIDDVVDGYVAAATAERLRRGLGPRPAVDRAQDRSTRSSITVDERRGGRRRPGRPHRRRSCARSCCPTPSHAYDPREAALGAEVMRELERRVVLSVLDRKWREHLYEMDYLQEGIGLRAMAQRDPLVEYQREGFLLFEAMMEAIKEESVGYLFNLEVQVEAPPRAVQDEVPVDGFEAAKAIRAKGLEAPQAPARLHYSAPSDDGSVDERDEVNGQASAEAVPTGRGRARPPRRQQEEQASPLTPARPDPAGPDRTPSGLALPSSPGCRARVRRTPVSRPAAR